MPSSRNSTPATDHPSNVPQASAEPKTRNRQTAAGNKTCNREAATESKARSQQASVGSKTCSQQAVIHQVSGNAPSNVDYEAVYRDARKKLEQRLTGFRLLHSISVSDIAALMANVYGVDFEQARIAGLLHDWDKNYTDDELLARAADFGITLPEQHLATAALLHAQTGACAVAREYPELPACIIQAIARHTSAAPDMSDLDMIIYSADMIEPLRSQSSLQPLRSIAGKVPLEDLFLKCFQTTLEHLIRRHRFIHPDSLLVWNTYMARARNREAGTTA
ncbi:MAG: bis(5'-nucleosyl)-tetraphosphatase (symmetrical) YqeK [Coriobacteriales bacterium]|jgi:predicted HD superfamily hydrolase involved in NAD metabolism|nr:bis(5'-nucleosyl)-tetraphosphatase (symmetrical) YqeK [Coriobacteriales bacterium]